MNSSERTAKGTILVVDDRPEDLRLLVEVLTADGYQVLPADSGELALISVAARTPDLILMDIRMEGLDGLEVYRRLRARPESCEIPAVLMSASGDHEDKVRALALGAVDFVSKPIYREELLARVQNHVEMSRLRLRLGRQAEALRRANARLARELEERRRNEAGFQALADVLQNQSATPQEFLDFALHQAVDLTLSSFGWIYSCHEDRKELVLRACSAGITLEPALGAVKARFTPDTADHLQMAEALAQRQPVVANNLPADLPPGKGQAAEDAALVRHLTLPILADNRVVALVCVGNKAQPYDETDVRQLRMLLEATWKVVEQREATQELSRSEDRFRRAVLQAPFPIMLHAEDGQILQVSDSWCELSGYSREELATVADWTALAYGDRQRCVQAEIEALYGLEHRKDEGDHTIHTKSSEVRRWDFSSAPLGRLPDGRRLVISMAMDVTERRRLEHERLGMEAQARQHQRLESIGILAGGVAHEINNPINGIINYAQLAQDRLEPGHPVLEFTGEILTEASRIVGIVRNLLTFARDETQVHSITRVDDIVEGVISLIRTVIRHDQIELNVDVPPNLPCLQCRSQQIQQALMNLMTNARDALNERFPTHHPDKVIHVSARQHARAGRAWIRFTVEDHGTGVTPEVRARMFDPFFTTKPRDRGTGLGLSITHGIVRDHRGEITVETEPGRFTRMHMDFPCEADTNRNQQSSHAQDPDRR